MKTSQILMQREKEIKGNIKDVLKMINKSADKGTKILKIDPSSFDIAEILLLADDLEYLYRQWERMAERERFKIIDKNTFINNYGDPVAIGDTIKMIFAGKPNNMPDGIGIVTSIEKSGGLIHIGVSGNDGLSDIYTANYHDPVVVTYGRRNSEKN